MTADLRTDCRLTRTRRGLTLIELIVAGVLTSVLAGAVLMLLRVTYADAVRLDRGTSVATTLLAEQLARDLTNSRGARIGRSRLTLTGFVATESRMPTLRRGRVGYSLASVAGVPSLLREERSERGTFCEVVWSGVGGFRVVDLAPTDPDDPIERDPDAAGLRPTPTVVLVELTDRGGRVILSERTGRIGVGP